MKIFLATDHAGFNHKEALKKHLINNGHEIVDCGAEKFVEGDDYVPYMAKAAENVSKDSQSKAVIFGGSGEGEAMVANRFPNVRATEYYGGPLEIIKLSREHNDANVLSIGARFVSREDTLKVVDLWLTTEFSNEERHIRRIKEIDEIKTNE